ncbi:flagellin [Candidatus Phycosocius spiralis]|uniref:Flagellin n=1 Tax=Candidatus Phycosocius spiralis TaxID=2815099 RepID=A0ABQ4PTL2_9PROT|nr:flagellin [Candidatus Phycosocius spiralis]GIU66338.1 flagellin FljK [Candidatus Phycosocius spiralis]
MISVNTNIASMAAIQNLASTNRDLAVSQKALSTGKKVADVADNGAIWVIANKMGSDVKAYDRVRESGERAGAILDTAIAAAESIMDRLNDMKGKALAAVQPGLSTSSLSALNADFVQLRDQIGTSVANATFDGANMIGTTPASAIALGDANGGNTITIAGVNLNLGQTTITVAANATLDTTGTSAGVTANTNILNAINTSITNLGTEMARLGAGAKRFDAHLQFVSKLQDALNTGIGAITDADLSKESARLQSLQVKQQLGVQALSIANSSTSTALSLFR